LVQVRKVKAIGEPHKNGEPTAYLKWRTSMTAMLVRTEVFEETLVIVKTAQKACFSNRPVWDFLYNVQKHIEARYKEEFDQEFREQRVLATEIKLDIPVLATR